MKKIAVVGAGPKAAALCAKAAVVNAFGKQITVRVFERNAAGSAWSGSYGYSDGIQRLCTPPERDVGFPYERGLLNSEGVQSLFSDYSWQAFLVDQGQSAESYRDWVDRGRKPPSHALYARYIRWVIRKAGFVGTRGDVTKIGHADGKWTITYDGKKTRQTYTVGDFDGVVVTGPGDAVTGFDRPNDPRITDGVAFWKDPEGFLTQGAGSEEPIVIAGSGGTSAAIAAWIARRGLDDRPIIIVGNQAALFTRTESFFENALFSDDDAWAALEPKDRVGVSQRLNRGVVWASVSELLSQARNVKFRPGRVLRAYVEAGVEDAPEEVRVEVRDARGARSSAASLVIDAAGFDTWWFSDLLDPRLRRATQSRGAKNAGERRQDLIATMGVDLSLELGEAGFHAPMLSLAQGPGFASLMVLGAMSERILRSYCEPVT